MPTASVKPFTERQRQSRPRVDAWIPIAVVVSIALIALARPVLQPGPFVSRVTVTNNSEYAYDVDVAGASAQGWTLLGTSGEHASTGIAEVYDQGSTWTFRFTTQGIVAGQIQMSRADLERAGWRVAVPTEFADRLRNDGVAPTAPTAPSK